MARTGRPTLYCDDLVAELLAAYRRLGSLGAACEEVGISRRTANGWAKRRKRFRLALAAIRKKESPHD